jgi:hypothetical protein
LYADRKVRGKSDWFYGVGTQGEWYRDRIRDRTARGQSMGKLNSLLEDVMTISLFSTTSTKRFHHCCDEEWILNGKGNAFSMKTIRNFCEGFLDVS